MTVIQAAKKRTSVNSTYKKQQQTLENKLTNLERMMTGLETIK